MELTGARVLLTGASQGIGPFVARRLAREGAHLVLVARSQGALDQIAAETGGEAFAADLSDAHEVERVIAGSGEVDVLVANAGVGAEGALQEMPVEELQNAIDVNLRAPLLLARGLLPGMLRRRRGHLVFMASMAGQIPVAAWPVYSTTKFGLRGLSHALRAGLRGTGVASSVVSPVYVTDVGIFARKNRRAAFTVSPDGVADAVARAIIKNRGEVTAAPFAARIGGRVGLALPVLAPLLARQPK